MKTKQQQQKLVESRLGSFAEEYGMLGKGPLAVALALTRSISAMKPPYDAATFVTAKKGQVKGLGKAAAQAVLADYEITRVLAEEGVTVSRETAPLAIRGYCG